MSNNIDAKYDALKLFGYTGAQEDMELQFYQSFGITSRNIRDAEMEFLSFYGYRVGDVSNRWKNFLIDRGFTGGVDDMLPAFWKSILATPTTPSVSFATLDLNFISTGTNTLYLSFTDNSYAVWEDPLVGIQGSYSVLV